jgi:hypothetical protein
MLYEEMKEKYPNKEIKLIPAEKEQFYMKIGFRTIDTCEEPAFGKTFKYCFMIEGEF